MFRMWKKTFKVIHIILTREEGATVVETTVIVPMIWVLIMGSILLLFFFFDMGVIRSETIRCAGEAAREWRTEEKDSATGEKQSLNSRINGRLLLSDLQTSNLTVSFGTSTVKTDICFYLGGKGLRFTDTEKVAVDNREDWIRLLSH